MNKRDERAMFCEKVRELRAENGLSKKEMAKIMGIGVGSLNKLEAGALPPRMGASVMINLSIYFDIKAGDLFL